MHLYDGWFTGNVIEVSDQNLDLQSKFMAKSLNNNLNWPLRYDISWLPVSDVLYTVSSLNVQSIGVHGCFLSNSEFNKVLNLFDELVA